MNYIDHHAHMNSRTTDDYEKMALSGCIAVTEPSFWAGWDRSGADSFEDYYRQLTVTEPARWPKRLTNSPTAGPTHAWSMAGLMAADSA